jgi:hypothetical protein
MKKFVVTEKVKAAARALIWLAAGGVASMFAMNVWGWVYWRDALPNKALGAIYDEGELVRDLQVHFPESGTYMIPGPGDDDAAIRELLDTGPVATFSVLNRRDLPSGLERQGGPFVQAFLSAFCIGWILRRARPALRRYRSRVLFVALIGFAAAIYADFAEPIWWYHPWGWSIARAIFDLTSWILAGLILSFDRFTGSVDVLDSPALSSKELGRIEIACQSLASILGAKLREIRQRREMTLTEMANELGTSAGRLSVLEGGVPSAGIDAQIRNLFALGLSNDDLAHTIAVSTKNGNPS